MTAYVCQNSHAHIPKKDEFYYMQIVSIILSKKGREGGKKQANWPFSGPWFNKSKGKKHFFPNNQKILEGNIKNREESKVGVRGIFFFKFVI